VKKTYWLLMWSNGLDLDEFRYRGKEIDFNEATKLFKDYKEDYQRTIFNGKSAVVMVVTIDQTLTRNQKLKFATDFINGNYKTIMVDLNTCTGIEVPGIVHSYFDLEKPPATNRGVENSV